MGLIFLTVLTIYFFKIPIFPNTSNKYFKAILLLSCVSIALDTISAIVTNNSSQYSSTTQYIISIVFFLTYWTLAFFFLRYTLLLSKQKKYIKSKANYFMLALVLFEQLAIITTAWTHAIFYIDPVVGYSHGFLYIPLAIINLIILFLAGLLVITKKTNFTSMQRIAIPMYIIILLVANGIQVFFPVVYLTGAALALATFIMFLTLQNPTSHYDSLTMVYSRESFQDYLSKLINDKSKFQVIIVDIVDTTIINRTLGEEIGSQIITEVALKLKNLCPNNFIFRLDGDVFIIVTEKEEERNLILQDLRKKFPFNHSFGASKISVHVHLNYSESLSDFEDSSEAICVIQDCAKLAKTNNSHLINESSLTEVMRSRKVELALKNAIDKKDFCVYLQPIYNTETNLYEKAEALVRIQDPELGLIMPFEFIDLAEKNGSITKLTPIVIEQVCKFISQTTLPSSFKTISINLSVIDFLNNDLIKEITTIINKYKIDPSKLVFELTETVASVTPQVEDTMNKLKEFGVEFALDDFGSGYANLDAVVKLPFDVVKIDRELVLLIQNNRYRVMLEGLIKIMKNLDLDIIVEGIETEDQSKLISNMGANTHQGYLYSKPVDLETFTDIININANPNK
jgi:diguanylate cyclase (GGDEF)-like protein